MKKIIILGLVGFGIFQAWGKYSSSKGLEPLYEEPYVAVYGRDSCGWTQKMIKDLKASDINYRYFIVDERSVASELHQRMELSGISTRRYNLPVVDVNGSLRVRPDINDVTAKYARR